MSLSDWQEDYTPRPTKEGYLWVGSCSMWPSKEAAIAATKEIFFHGHTVGEGVVIEENGDIFIKQNVCSIYKKL